MKNILLIFVGLIWPILNYSQIPDSINQVISPYESHPYPGRLDSMLTAMDPLRPSTDLYLAVVNKEYKIAEEKGASPLTIASILFHKVGMLAAKLDLAKLSSTNSKLRQIIQDNGDLKQEVWKKMLGRTYIFSAYISSAQYLDDEAISELNKAILIFEELKDNKMLSECYLDMYVYMSDAKKPDAERFLLKLDSLAKVIPLNSNIVSGYIHKMSILDDEKRYTELQQMVSQNKDSIMHYAPWYEFEVQNYTAIAAMNLQNHQLAYDIYQPIIEDIYNHESEDNIRGQVEIVSRYCKLLQNMKRYEAALVCHDTLNSLLQTQYKIFRDDAITDSKAKYNKLEDENKIQLLESEKQLDQSRFRTILIGLISLMSLIVGGFFFWRSQQKQKQQQQFQLIAKEKETQKIREKLLTSITHELRTPLSIISAKLESLESADTQIQKTEHLTVAKRNTKQLVDQFNQLLEWSKFEANALTNRPIIGDAKIAMEQTVETLKSFASHKKIEWKIDVKPQNYNSKLDYSKFQTIARNLISNAIKYSPSNSTIQLKMYQDASQLVFSVQDAGPGIPSAYLSKIFEWYYRVASEDNEARYEGFGIGLALSKEMAELMGGTLSVQSKNGNGTTFILKVPFEMVQPTTQITSRSEVAQVPNTDTTISMSDENSLLIIEDHPDLAAHIASLFRDHYEVLIAHNLKQGKQLAQQQVPDVIISDVMLPDGSGLELCQQLKSHMVTNHIPILVLTAKAGDETKFTSLKTGVDAFMNKPFKNEELLLTVNNLIQNRRRLHLKFGNKKEALPNSLDAFSEMVMNVLEANYSNSKFTLDHFARELHISKSQAYKKFRATFDNTPANLLRDFRLEKGKQMLQQKDLKIAEIAYACGFTSPEYFSTVFKEFFNQSPSAYRG